MPRLPSANRKYEPKHLWGVHKEVLRRLAIGQRPKDVARDLGVSKAMVSYTANSKLGRRETALLEAAATAETANIMKRIRSMSHKALDVMEEIMLNGQKDSDRGKMAIEILHMAGFSPVKRYQEVPSDDVLEEIKRRARELTRSDGATLAVTADGEEEAEDAK